MQAMVKIKIKIFRLTELFCNIRNKRVFCRVYFTDGRILSSISFKSSRRVRQNAFFVKFPFKQTSVTARCYLAVYRQVSTNVLKYIKYELNKLFVEE